MTELYSTNNENYFRLIALFRFIYLWHTPTHTYARSLCYCFTCNISWRLEDKCCKWKSSMKV